MKHISESLPEVPEETASGKPKIIDIPEPEEEESTFETCPLEICDGSGKYEDEDGYKRKCPHVDDEEADMDDDSADE